MTYPYQGGSNQTLFDSPADWVSPIAGRPDEAYIDNPSPAYRRKVIVNDADPLGGHTLGDRPWVWKSFCRSLNVLFMETLDPSPTWQDSAHQTMGQECSLFTRLDLTSLMPHGELTSTPYCLARSGGEYLVFQPCDGSFTLDLSGASGQFTVLWSDGAVGDPMAGETITGGEVCNFTPPFKAPLV